MMHQEARFGYAKRESFTALQLPYVGRQISMMVLLPRSLGGVGELEENLTPELLKELRKESEHIDVNVAIPKFKFEYSNSVTKTLQALGLNSVFEPNADLKGISDDDTFVSDIIHKAVIEVNESGSEAAAATAILMVKYCMMIEQVPSFVVDRPFLFTIYDEKDGTILFLGRIEEL